jgi:hypothetical protein
MSVELIKKLFFLEDYSIFVPNNTNFSAMRIKRLLLAVVIVLSAFRVNAQDLIVKQDGETIKAYRTDIGNTTVYYRLEENENSPLLTIPKSDVLIIKMQDGTKIVMDETSPQINKDVANNGYIPKYPSEPVADPEMIANAEIGSLIEFYDGTKGIVFYLDGNGHGLVVYLYEGKSLLWQNASSWRDCVDIEAIPNERNTEIQIGLGAIYSEAAIKQLGLEEVPAIKWCQSIGPDWYLPSFGELYELLIVANHSKGGKGPISRAIKANGGDSFSFISNYYLSSSEEDNTNVYSIFHTGEIQIVKKYTSYFCRAVRMF